MHGISFEAILKQTPLHNKFPFSLHFQVLSFGTVGEANKWLLANPMQTTGALHFQQQSSSVIAYGIQSNSTSKNERGIYEDPTFTFQIPLQLAAEREITRVLTGGMNPYLLAAHTIFIYTCIYTAFQSVFHVVKQLLSGKIAFMKGPL